MFVVGQTVKLPLRRRQPIFVGSKNKLNLPQLERIVAWRPRIIKQVTKSIS